MKKQLLLFFAFLFIMTGLRAQNTTFGQGDNVLNLGIGIGSTLYSGSYYTNRIPPISASYEVGVKDELFDENSSLGVGGYLGYTGAKWDYMNYGWTYSSVILGARGAVHYQFIDNLDTYAGLMLGYNVVSSKAHGTAGLVGNAVGSAFNFSIFLGGRYYFSDNFAGFLELGYGIAVVNLGVALKI